MRTFSVKTKYCNEEAMIRFGKYGNGETAIGFVDAMTGQPLITVTVNLEAYGEHPKEGCVFIKDWNENEGVYESMRSLLVIGPSQRKVPISNGLEAYECPLLVQCQEREKW